MSSHELWILPKKKGKIPVCHLEKYLGLRRKGHRVDIYELLMASDLFVLPSLHEGGAPPFAVMEAVSSKVPFIVTEATNARETFIDREDGLICQTKDIASLSESISWAVANPEAMTTMAENAYGKFLKHTDRDMATQTLDLVRSLTAE